MSAADTSDKAVPKWHRQEENILKSWAEISASYRHLHNSSYAAYKSMYAWFSLPVILLSTIAGTANFATASFPESWRENVTLCVGALNLTAGMITTVAQFFSISENLEGHRVSSIEFGKLSRNISIELSLPVQQRSMSGSEFIQNCRTRLDSLMEKSPNIPYKIVKRFGSTFEEGGFSMPDILNILPVDVYRDADEEFEKEKKKIEAMRAAAADEVRLQIETKAEEVARKRHEMKKKRLSAVNIADSMSRFISTMDTTAKDVEEKSDDGSDITVATMDLLEENLESSADAVEAEVKSAVEGATSLVSEMSKALGTISTPSATPQKKKKR